MSSKIIFNNETGSIAIDEQLRNLSAPTSQGQSVISDGTKWITQDASLSWRNKVINGDMRVAQRGSGPFSGDCFPVDRFNNSVNIGTVTSSQSSVAPAGFSNSNLFSVTTGASATASQYANIQTRIEGNNIYDLAWGTADAKPVTLSFWVRSSIIGTYCTSLTCNRIGASHSYVMTYSISAQNTWEKKTFNIPGLTTSPSINTDASEGLRIHFDLGTGSNYQTSVTNAWTSGVLLRTSAQTNLIGTTGATFYLTGVQLEIGSVATPFETLQYQQQLLNCQRYFSRIKPTTGNYTTYAVGFSSAGAYISYPQHMRSTPTITAYNTAVYQNVLGAAAPISSITYGNFSATIFTSATLAFGFRMWNWVSNNTTDSYVDFNAEL